MFETLVIGAGQAGLAASYYLKRAGRHFAVPEVGGAPTGSWPQYYESLWLFSPARYSSLPGSPFPGEPDRYPLRDEVSVYLQAYAAHFRFPVRCHQQVTHIKQVEGSFQVLTAVGGHSQARTIIAATGPFRQPALPTFPSQDSFGGRSCTQRPIEVQMTLLGNGCWSWELETQPCRLGETGSGRTSDAHQSPSCALCAPAFPGT